MVKLQQDSESDADRQHGQHLASSLEEATTCTTNGKESTKYHGSFKSCKRWWGVLVVVAMITLVLVSIAWVVTEFTQNQPTEDTVWNRLDDFVRTQPGNLRPPAPGTGQRLGSNGHEVADSHGILADITAEFGLQQYERSGVIASGGGKYQGGHQASATTQSTLSPEEQECVQMRAALHMSTLDNRGEAGMADQQRWELLGCTGRLNRVGYPGGERDLVDDDRTVGLSMAEAAASTAIEATPRQTLPPRSRILSELQVTEANLSEEKGQQQGEVEDMNERMVEAAMNVEKLPALLVIAVVTIRPERRTAIRNSWLAWGDDRLVLRFFTEAPDESMPAGKVEARDLEIESAAYGDVVILDIERGMNFALKLLTAMKYVSARYDFDFFLRLDDDYFVCLDHLLDELETAKKLLTAEMMENLVAAGGESNPPAQLPQPMIYAGFRYCKRRATRIDEAYMLLSGALVHRVLSIPGLRCGAHAGVTAGSWFTVGNEANKNGDVRWVHDHRLDHHGSLWKRLRTGEVTSSTLASVCQVQMGVHHSYPKEMGMLWEAAQHGATAEGKGAWGGDTEEFQYKADTCPTTGAGVVASTFEHDNLQPCESYHSTRARHCGAQGC